MSLYPSEKYSQTSRPWDLLVPRLDGVMHTQQGCCRAICPAHPSKHRSRSLTIRELDDGRLLMKCFAGCDVDQITAALGLTVGDLFPQLDRREIPERHRRETFNPRDVLAALGHEAIVLAVIASDLERGEPLTKAVIDRISLAAERLLTGAELAGVRPPKVKAPELPA